MLLKRCWLMTCWSAFSLFISRMSHSSQRGHGSRKLFPGKVSAGGKAKKVFVHHVAAPPRHHWFALRSDSAGNLPPGRPSPKRLVANCITKAGVPTQLPCFGVSVILWSRIGLWWADNAFFSVFLFQVQKAFFCSPASLPTIKGQAVAFTASAGTHPCRLSAAQNPPVLTQESKLRGSYHSETSASKKPLSPPPKCIKLKTSSNSKNYTHELVTMLCLIFFFPQKYSCGQK